MVDKTEGGVGLRIGRLDDLNAVECKLREWARDYEKRMRASGGGRRERGHGDGYGSDDVRSSE